MHLNVLLDRYQEMFSGFLMTRTMYGTFTSENMLHHSLHYPFTNISGRSMWWACRQSRRQGHIQLSGKTGLPMLSGTEQYDRAASSQSQKEGYGTISVPTARRLDERSDEKKERKNAVKEAKVGYLKLLHLMLCHVDTLNLEDVNGGKEGVIAAGYLEAEVKVFFLNFGC